MEPIVEAWHFLPSDRRLRFGRREFVQPGQAYKVTWPYEGCSKPTLCAAGMHASRRAIDALGYAPGPIICRVLVRGRIVEGHDKLAGDERGVLWMADAEPTLREFARWCARSVLGLWDAPKIVGQYLETGDESIQHPAQDAAVAAWDVAGDAAGAAAWAAASGAAVAAAGAARNAAVAAWGAAVAAAREKQNAELERLLFTLEPKK